MNLTDIKQDARLATMSNCKTVTIPTNYVLRLVAIAEAVMDVEIDGMCDFGRIKEALTGVTR